ncbi:bacteriocin class II family protein, partial [Paraglaciecola sp.]|uniref:bacteriocin class II family protein n=1 Tax=Paraglaciecola sp. TaxID=1920173 RepID=UPI003EF0D5FD
MADINSLTDEQLEQVALGKISLDEAVGKTSYYTADNIDELSDEQLAMVAAGTPLSEIKKERNEFVGMGTSIGGALTGAAVGTAILPGVGTAIGGLIGGAVGAFGGELAEDQLQGEDLNYANAAKEAAISAGIDVATLGVAKWAKPAYYAGKRALGFTAEEVAQDIVQKAVVDKGLQVAGTQTSLAATQDLLSTTGATLTPSQVGGDGILEFYENIGRGGIASGKLFEENMVKVNDAVSGAINDLIGKHQAGVALKGELGESVDNVLYEAKKSLGKQYEIGLREVESLIKNDKVNVIGIHEALEGFLKSKTNKLGGSSLQNDALRIIKDLQKDLSNGFKVEDIVETVRVPVKGLFGETTYRNVSKVTGKKKVPVPLMAKQLI